MDKSVVDIQRRLDCAKKAIEELESGKTLVMLDDVYFVKVTEKCYSFWDKRLNKRLSSIPRNCEHKTEQGCSYKPDHPYIDVITKYLSLPVVD